MDIPFNYRYYITKIGKGQEKMKKSTKNIYYDIGLDIGTNSVGYAVTDIEGNLVKIKGEKF